ncbi:MAG: hypothetical protein C9356_12505 [Oleiphilus sp.]|nr:MAG: hypothetical protein C9356_12505 [Oleiphilus sp.]
MSEHSLDASVIVDLDGNLRQNAKRFQQALGTMSRTGGQHLTRLQRTTARLDRVMGRLGNRWVALASGGTVVAAGRQVLDFDAKLLRMQTSARMSDKQAASLKERLQEIANSDDIRVPIDDLTDAVAQFLDKTGDTDYAQAQLHNIGMMMQGLGVEARSAGLLLAQFWEDGIQDPAHVEALMDRLFYQFSQGSVSVADIARVSSELFSTVRRQGPDAIAEIGALAQVYAKTAGNASKAQTSLKATVRILDNAKKAAIIDKALVSAGLEPIRQADGMIRSLPELLLDITKVAKDSAPVLSSIFDGEAFDGLKSLLDPKNKALLMDMVNGTVELNLTQRASIRNAGSAAAALTSLRNVAREFADTQLSGPIQELADSLNDLGSERLMEVLDTALEVAAALGMVLVGYKALRAGTNVYQGAKSLGKAGGGLAETASMAAPIPVFVVNNISGLGGGSGAKTPGKNGGPGKVGKLTKLGSKAAMAGSGGLAATGAFSVGYGIGSVLNEALEGTAFYDWLGASIARAMALGSDDARAAVDANGDRHPIYGNVGWSNPTAKQKEVARVELTLDREASKLLKPKTVERSEKVDVEASSSFGGL